MEQASGGINDKNVNDNDNLVQVKELEENKKKIVEGKQ